MSIQAMVWVLEKSMAEKGARLVLLSIANHAKADGTGAWPSIKQVARESRLSEREVYYAKNELISLGELAVESGAGPKGTNLYYLQKMQAEQIAPAIFAAAKGAGTPCKKPPDVLHTGADEPSKTEPSTTEPSIGAQKTAPRPRKPKSIPVPEGFSLTPVMREFAVERGVAEPEREFEKFLDKHGAVGSQFVNWEKAWHTWVHNCGKFNGVNHGKGGTNRAARNAVNSGRREGYEPERPSRAVFEV